MDHIGRLKNTIQAYAWGSLTAIPALLGRPSPADIPQAELWMGAHPRGPSRVVGPEGEISLIALIQDHADDLLGARVVEKFGKSLPFLFKVLAAARPLSIQAHPNMTQAKRGFEDETRAGIGPDAPERNYRDANHKPECICALTHFWALNGFRRIAEICRHLKRFCPRQLAAERQLLAHSRKADGLKRFFSTLMSFEADRRKSLVAEALAVAEGCRPADPVSHWMCSLQEAYPFDVGVLSPLILNLVHLEPGQAMFLEAGELHAYLEGTGIELMANSDNVLRGGLTSKHVDISELLKILNFRERDVQILSPRKTGDYELCYDSPADEFVLSVICLPAGAVYQSSRRRSVEILLCTDGQGTIRPADGGEALVFEKGDSLVVPAVINGYGISGRTTLYKAAVPV